MLPSATAESAYTSSITASGGNPPYAFSLPSGTPYPPGLPSRPLAPCRGLQQARETTPFTIQAQDSSGSTGSKAYLLSIAGPAILSLAPSMVPPATAGMPYNSVITASGGVPPYTFSIATGSSLPSGFSFLAGVLSGTPGNVGTYPFTVQVQDFNAATGMRAYVLNVVAGQCPYSISPGGQVFSSTGGNGVLNVTTNAGCAWAITNVPSWVNFTGTASATGSGAATFQLGVNTGPGQSTVLAVAGLPFTVEQQASSISGMNLAGSMPHIAAEENWTTTITPRAS